MNLHFGPDWVLDDTTYDNLVLLRATYHGVSVALPVPGTKDYRGDSLEAEIRTTICDCTYETEPAVLTSQEARDTAYVLMSAADIVDQYNAAMKEEN